MPPSVIAAAATVAVVDVCNNKIKEKKRRAPHRGIGKFHVDIVIGKCESDPIER